MSDEAENNLVSPDALPTTEMEAMYPNNDATSTKRKKNTKRKAPPKRVLQHKKILSEPAEESGAASTPFATTAPNETRPEVAASLENIYRNRNTGESDMGVFEIKKNNAILTFFGWFLFIGVAVCAAGLLAWWYVAPNIKSVGDQVALELKVPDSVELGTTTTLSVLYTNNESVAIRNTVLQLYYPTGFVPTDTSLPATNNGKNEWLLGTIPSQESRTITISGRMYAPLATEQTVRALLSYRPDGFESTFQKNVHVPIVVSKSPFTLTFAALGQSVVGVAQPYALTVTQTTPLPGSQLAIELNAPDSFSITSSTLPYKNQSFVLTNAQFSTSTNSASVAFNGTWEGVTDQTNTVVDATLTLTPPGSSESFSIATTAITSTLAKNEASLSLAVNGSTKLDTVQPGDVLATTLQVSNNGKTTLKNGTVKLVYEGPAIAKTSAFNWANLSDVKNGTVTGEATKPGLRRGVIVWTSKQIPALSSVAPGATVLIDVTLPIKDAQSFDWSTVSTGTNFSVQSAADFVDDSKKNIHVESSLIAMKLRTNVALDVRDTTDPGNALAHNITWVVTNNLHPLKNLEVSATLYGNVAFTAPTTTSAGTVTYDKKTKEIRWNIPEMPVGVDVLAMPFTVTITKTNPTQSQLESKVRFKATDSVTGDSIELLGEDVPLTR